jgi:hypothetical protein
MALTDSDRELGQRLAGILVTRRPVTLAVAMSILEDLIGAEVSLLPAMQMLAGQPIFLQFINSGPEAFLLPLKDSLIAASRDTLAPQLVDRVESFLAGYMGICSPLKANGSPPMAAPPTATFPDVVAARSPAFPATEIADAPFSGNDGSNPQPTLLSTPPERQGHNFSAGSSSFGASASGHSGNVSNAIKSIPGWILFPILIAAGWYVLFKVPAVCDPFDLCSKETPSKSNRGKPKPPPSKGAASGAASSSPATPPASSPGRTAALAPEPAPSRHQPSQPRYIPPTPSYQAPPPAAEESHQPSSSAPLRNEPLW